MESDQKKSNGKIKWCVIAGCLLLAAAAILIIGRKAGTAERVEDPALVSLEEPVVQKEDFKAIVESNIAVQGTVRECAYFRVEAGRSVCFIVSMTVDVDAVLHGEVDAASIRIVSASGYTDTDVGDAFPVRDGLLDCEPGAFLYYGFDHEISREELEERIRNNTLTEVLNAVPVKKGDCFFIPSGFHPKAHRKSASNAVLPARAAVLGNVGGNALGNALFGDAGKIVNARHRIERGDHFHTQGIHLPLDEHFADGLHRLLQSGYPAILQRAAQQAAVNAPLAAPGA